MAGLVFALGTWRRDRLPLFFLVHLVTLPLIRMLETPAHDGVRLFLPTFFFLASFAGWGVVWVADGLARPRRVRADWVRGVVATLVLVPAAWQLVRIHPFELSYYNELIGGPRGAWKAGFELSYWYDAFNDRTLAEINDVKVLPPQAAVDFLNEKSNPDTFHELQSLGYLRGDLYLGTALRGSISLRLAPDPGLQGVGLHTLAIRDEALVCVTPPATGRSAGGHHRRPLGGFPGLGPEVARRRLGAGNPPTSRSPPRGSAMRFRGCAGSGARDSP